MLTLAALGLSLLTLAAAPADDPRILVIGRADGSREAIAAASPDTCNAAIAAIYRGWWRLDGARVTSAACIRGNLFAPSEACIRHFNCPRNRPNR